MYYGHALSARPDVKASREHLNHALNVLIPLYGSLLKGLEISDYMNTDKSVQMPPPTNKEEIDCISLSKEEFNNEKGDTNKCIEHVCNMGFLLERFNVC